jgi:hypothetical protein
MLARAMYIKINWIALDPKLLESFWDSVRCPACCSSTRLEEVVAMATELREILDELKLQRSILQDGGYGRSVRTPWKPTALFRDSVTCLNFGEAVRKHPCSECLLWEWVPETHQNEEIPCHHIPLNEKGDSIATLQEEADRDRAEQALLAWLDATIERLEERLRRGEKVATGG